MNNYDKLRGCTCKKAFPTEAMATFAIGRLKDLHVYKCHTCQMFHLGHAFKQSPIQVTDNGDGQRDWQRVMKAVKKK